MNGLAARLVGAGNPVSYSRLALVWLATRAIAIASIALTPRLLDDVDLYREWLPYLHWAQFPIADPKWQYPPGAGAVLTLPDLVPINYSVAFTVMCLLLDAAIMGMLVLTHVRRPDPSRAGLWMWAVAALVVGPIMYTRFDIVPALFAVAFVLLVSRPALAGVSAALGFVVKIWPVILLVALPRPATRRGVLAFVTTTAVALLLLAARFDGTLSFLANQRARGLQVESAGALPFEIYTLAHGQVAYGLQYGSYQVLMNGAEVVGTIVSAVGLVLLALMAWWRLSGRLDTALPGDVAVVLVLISVATSRVYSPQYNIWIIAVLAAALMSRRTRLRRVAVILAAVSLLTQLVYPWFPYDLTDGKWAIVAVQCLRIAGLLAASWLAIRAISQRPPLSAARDGILADDGRPDVAAGHSPAQEGRWTYSQEGRSR
jgi:hypothetical protein